MKWMNDTEITPKKIYILGTPESGKTTIAKKIAEKINILHIDLDTVGYNQNGRVPDKERFAITEKMAE